MNQRKNFLHHESKRLVIHFNVMDIEDLNIKKYDQNFILEKTSPIFGGVCSFFSVPINKTNKENDL